MKKIYSSSVSNSAPKSPKVTKVVGENGDVQFSSSGSGIIDLLANGADKFIQKSNQDAVNKFKTLVLNAFKENKDLTKKAARYFLDSENGQNLKEQTPLLLAILTNELSFEDVIKILTINPEGEEGALALNEVDYLTMVRTLSWNHYLNGRDSKLGFGTCRAFAEIIFNDPYCLQKVLQFRSRNLQYDTTNDHQVGIIDVLGIIRNFKSPKMPEELAKEYDEYLYPRYRRQRYHVKPQTALGKKYYQFFKGELKSGEVPNGISFDKVMSMGNKAAIRKMIIDGRLSNTQFKINLNTVIELLTDNEIEQVFSKRKFNLFPHEILGMAKAFLIGTAYTKANNKGVEIANEMLKTSIREYKTKVKENVIFLGDTSGSMRIPLSEKSTIYRDDFSSFMSYFASQVCSHKTFGVWDSDAHLFDNKGKCDIKEFLTTQMSSNANTNVYNAIVSTGQYFANKPKEQIPTTICLISDMQFDQVINPRYSFAKSKTESLSVEAAKKEYKKITGITPKIVFWNVDGRTVPSTKNDDVLLISGFSANTADIIFGILNENTKTESKLEREDLVKVIDSRYK